MVEWPDSLVTAGCNTHPKHMGDSGLEELQNTQDLSFLPYLGCSPESDSQRQNPSSSLVSDFSQGPSYTLSPNLNSQPPTPSRIRLHPCCGWNSSPLRLTGPTEAWSMARSTSLECTELGVTVEKKEWTASFSLKSGEQVSAALCSVGLGRGGAVAGG